MGALEAPPGLFQAAAAPISLFAPNDVQAMTKISCKDCRHFKTAPYEAPHTGCWHPDNLVVKQKEAYLDQQQTPGDHRTINLRGNCAQYEAKPRRPSFLERLRSMGAA